ncbi:hypothetical protein HHK36_010346 [Tetracentron sinense]|uniref:DUF4283 domain-containing protein n=1 Tax=Tetracentron sinense TaxID=13715 RepID=A0A834ZE52_TETSI|nr:hypothetical protein HHK36_010346 [Tetracentron sinense]
MNCLGVSEQQFPTSSDNRLKNDVFFEGSKYPVLSINSNPENGYELPVIESSVNKGLGHDKNSINQESGSTLYGLWFPILLRASILGDAIEFVKELQKQVKDLQDEIEESDGEDVKNSDSNNSVQAEMLNPNKVQVDVSLIARNEFFLKVFCDHKPGGFVRLMEALNSLGLEVKKANVTTFKGLVSNVFRIIHLWNTTELYIHPLFTMTDLSDQLLQLSLSENKKLVTLDEGVWLEACHDCERGLLGRFVTDRPLNWNVAKATIIQARRTTKGVHVTDLNDDVILFKFVDERDMQNVLRHEPWSFNGHLLQLTRWIAECTTKEINFGLTPFWVQLHELPTSMITKRVGQALGGEIGEVLDVDLPQGSHSRGK